MKQNDPYKIISQSFLEAIDVKNKKSTYDKTYNGHIELVLFDKNTPKDAYLYGKYVIRYNNGTSTIKINDGIVHAIGDKCMVYVPSNDLTQKYAEVVTKCGLTNINILDKVEKDTDNITDIYKKDITFTYKNALGDDSEVLYKMKKKSTKINVDGKTVEVNMISEIETPDGSVITVTRK